MLSLNESFWWEKEKEIVSEWDFVQKYNSVLKQWSGLKEYFTSARNEDFNKLHFAYYQYNSLPRYLDWPKNTLIGLTKK